MITLKYQDQTLNINPQGGGIMEYYQKIGDERTDIIYGYSDNDVKVGLPTVASPQGAKVGSQGDVLFPFPGRVEKSHYNYQGRDYKLSDVKIKDGHAIHGFAKLAEWEVEGQTESQVKLSFTIKKEEYATRGYPLSIKLSLIYQLDDDGLKCRAIVENFGEDPAPFGLGFHPYFTVGTEKIDDMVVTINAAKLVEFDQGLKPTGKLLDVAGSEVNFSEPAKIGDRIIDNCYTDLQFSHLGGAKAHPRGVIAHQQIAVPVHQTTLSDDHGHKITIWQDQNFPYLQVYSADTIGEKHTRRGFAVEPQTCTGFAFNVEGMGLRVLQPGQIFEGSWGVCSN